MKASAQITLALAGVVLASPVFGQSTPSDLSDLVGARGAGGETQLEARGYRHIKTETSSDSKYSYWWNASKRACVSVRTFDGRYAAIVATLPADCGMPAGGGSGGGGLGNEVPRIIVGRNGQGEVIYSRNNCVAYYDRFGSRTRALPACRPPQLRHADDAMARYRREQGLSGPVADHEGGGGYRPGALPGGSWNQSCVAGRMVRSVLHAQCEDTRRRRINTSIDMNHCKSGNVRNTNGQLTCIPTGFSGAMPTGSWAQSCRSSSMRDNILYATCDNGNGAWNPTEIDLRVCPSRRVKNDYGRLICE